MRDFEYHLAADVQSALETLRKPTRIIWGEHDELFPVAVGSQLHASIRDSELVVIKGSGHMPMWEKPDETNQAILDFLGRPQSSRVLESRHDEPRHPRR